MNKSNRILISVALLFTGLVVYRQEATAVVKLLVEHSTVKVRDDKSTAGVTESPAIDSPPTSQECSAHIMIELCREHDCQWCHEECLDNHYNDDVCSPILYRSFMGGIGNRLWQFLSVLGMANQHDCVVRVDPKSFQMISDVFQINTSTSAEMKVAPPDYKTSEFLQRNEANYDRYRNIHVVQNNTVINGYLQHYQYLAKSADEFQTVVGQTLKFRPEIMEEAGALLDSMASCQDPVEQPVVSSWIGLHYRRFPDRHKMEPPPSAKDTVQFVNEVLMECQGRHQGSVADKKNATCRDTNITNTLSPCCALIFSNDPDWTRLQLLNITCARFVQNDFLLDPGLQQHNSKRNNGWATHYGRDMASMSLCEELILTVGTFGYFAGILHGSMHEKNDDSAAQVYLYRKSHAARREFQPSSWKLWG